MTEISICIATYRRPEGLANLLRSLAEQSHAPDFDVVIVDNDDAPSAGKICERYSANLRLRLVHEPRPGLAAARNRGVGAATGRFIAFIDDDEIAEPDWLARLHARAVASNADGVFGPVAVELDPATPKWVRATGFFDYPPLRDGDIVPWYWTRTSNALIRRAALPGPAPFDEALGRTGGEDVALFARMIAGGARMVAAADAGVVEHREAARSSPAWLLRRAFRNGGTISHVEWSARPASQRAGMALARLVRALGGLARAAWRLPRGRAPAFRGLLDAAQDLGQAAWAVGLVHHEYGR